MTDTDLWHSTSCEAAAQIMIQGFNQSTNPGYSEFNDSDAFPWDGSGKGCWVVVAVPQDVTNEYRAEADGTTIATHVVPWTIINTYPRRVLKQ